MSSERKTAPSNAAFLAGGGTVGKLMRAKRWHDTPLGPPESWHQSLKTVVRILLTSRYQMWMCWGPQLTMFYNDAYGPTLGVKQQWALGASAQEVWKEIWPDIGPRLEHVLQSGEATWDEGLLLFLERSGYPEETYHTFSYSPLADDDGRIVGMLCVVTEETERVIGERRLFGLRDFAAGMAGNNTLSMVFEAVPRQLNRNLKDLPFTLTYLFDEQGNASLACCSGVDPNHPIAPARIDPKDPNAAWPAEEILARRTALNLSDLKERFAVLPMGAWDKPPREAIIVPIAQQGREMPAGFLVAGINPYRRMDDAYLGFINLVAGQISSGLANAQAYEEAQSRAEALEQLVADRTADLRDKEARLRTIFGTSYTYQGYMSTDGTVLDANATSLAGIDAELRDVVGKPYWQTPWFTGTPGMSEIVRDAIPLVAAGEVVRREIYVNLPQGGWRWFDFQMRPVRDSHNNVVAIVPEAVEVSERRLAEEALRQAQKMEGIGQLTGGVAHDFNNLLTIIVGSLETVRRQIKQAGFDAANIEHLVDSAMRGAQRAASLTQRLLAFSRQQPLDPKPIDLSRLVTGMSDLLHRTIGEQISIETVMAAGLWRTNIDANQLEMAIINLAVNARDAMPNGGKLTIETANVSLDEGYTVSQEEVIPGLYVMLAVTDNGVGMTRETVTKAFEPFFTTKDIGHGTGLGLSQVYGFVKQSGGHVKIYSELGQGTSVKIYLPRLYSSEPVPAGEPPPRIAKGRDGETVLAVEDDIDVRAHTCGILRELGYRVLEAANGVAALEILQAHPEIDLLFTDVGLPGGMNGRQLAGAARKFNRKLKVLFTTGYARNAIVHEGRLDPGVQLITKPFTYAALSGKVRDMLDARAAPPRILVVEDEDLIQMILASQLEDLGFEVEIVGSAAAAKSKLALLQGQVDGAIVDLGLPDATGDSLVRELRALYPTLPIVISSGYDQATLRERFPNERSIALLSKPFTAEQLEAAIRDLGIKP
jgi:signal transduction histidine kinase/DNA-binding response OmpR family regulator